MQVTFHRFPGRLRLRFTQLKRRPLFAEQVASAIRALDGVLSADASAATGALLIVYDVGRADRSRMWSALEAVLAAHALREREHPPCAQADGTAWFDKVAEVAVGAVVEKLAAGSALALLAALF